MNKRSYLNRYFIPGCSSLVANETPNDGDDGDIFRCWFGYIWCCVDDDGFEIVSRYFPITVHNFHSWSVFSECLCCGFFNGCYLHILSSWGQQMPQGGPYVLRLNFSWKLITKLTQEATMPKGEQQSSSFLYFFLFGSCSIWTFFFVFFLLLFFLHVFIFLFIYAFPFIFHYQLFFFPFLFFNLCILLNNALTIIFLFVLLCM